MDWDMHIMYVTFLRVFDNKPTMEEVLAIRHKKPSLKPTTYGLPFEQTVPFSKNESLFLTAYSKYKHS